MPLLVGEVHGLRRFIHPARRRDRLINANIRPAQECPAGKNGVNLDKLLTLLSLVGQIPIPKPGRDGAEGIFTNYLSTHLEMTSCASLRQEMDNFFNKIFISNATPFFQKFVDNPFYGQIKCVGLMVAEDLLGAN